MKLNHTSKRLTAGLLSCAMALSLCAPVLAEGSAALPTAEPGTSQLDETGDIPIDPAHFPDEHFRDRVEFYCDQDGDRILSQEERNSVTELYVNQASIKDLTGIELFPNLETLDCKYNQLASLDVSQNTKLTKLYCYNNQLTSLDLSKNTALAYLYCYNNQLASLDVSKNTELTSLDCAENQLTSLDVSFNTALETLSCDNNQLACLDLNKNIKLVDLFCYENQREIQTDALGRFDLSTLPGFDLSRAKWPDDVKVENGILTVPYNTTSLTYQYDTRQGGSTGTYQSFTLIFDEVKDPNAIPITADYFPDENFLEYVKTFDKDGDGSLSQAERDIVTEISVVEKGIKDLTGVELFPKLETLDCKSNQLISLDVSQNSELKLLSCSSNQLTNLDLSKNSKLATLECHLNDLTSLNLTGSPQLNYLNCDYNKLANLDLSKNAVLVYLFCSENLFTSLDLSKNTGLTTLACENNQLTRLDLSSNTALIGLSCSGNKYPITVSDSGQFDLSTLQGFDLSRAKWPDDVKVENGILTVPYNTTSLTYQYDTRQGGSTGTYQSFTFTFDEVKDPNAIPITADYFPDKAFLDYVIQEIDTDGDGILSTAEQNDVTVINVSGLGISDLTGIEHFPHLKSLKCYDNQLTKLYVSQNTELVELECYGNQLDELDVRENVMLAYLYCYNNRLTSLDLSRNAYLIELGCSGNKLTSLDLSQNTDLTRLICSKNQLTSLDLSKNTDLNKLDCSDNKFQITVSGTGQFDLSTLPGFDASKAKWPADTAVWENILTVPYGTTELSYEYDLGNGETGTFTLTFGEIEEPAPVTPEDPENPMDPEFGLDAEGGSAGGAIAAAALGGAAVWGGYEITTRIILHDLLPEGADIPASRGQLALLIWTEKGKPEPAAQPAFADVNDPETAKAAQWCVEQGLLTAKKDGSFDPDGWTPKYRVIQVWNQAFPKR